MNTEHILFYPHKEYNTEKEITDNLRNKDYFIGQRVPCEEMKQKIGESKDNE